MASLNLNRLKESLTKALTPWFLGREQDALVEAIRQGGEETLLAVDVDTDALQAQLTNLYSNAGAGSIGTASGQTVQVQLDSKIPLTQKAAANGVATLDAATKIPVAQIPALAISNTTGLQAALDTKAPINNPTFTGTVNGITKGMVGLGNVDNTSDANKPVSTAQQSALDTKVGLAALAASAGSSLVGFIQAGVGAVLRTVQSKLRDHVHIADFGATGVAGVDATAAFQAAVNALPAAGGTIYLDPGGSYLLSGAIVYFKPIMWKCARGHGDISTNTNGGDAEKPEVVWWSGAGVVAAMFVQQPATVGTLLWGGGMEGITLNGSEFAEHGLHLNNCRYSTVSGKARNFTKAGLLISSLAGTTNLFSKKVHVKDWEYIYGVNAATANSHGIRILGNGSTVPSTQHRVDRLFALIKHGAAVKIEETDNCQFGSVQAVADNGAGGGGGVATGCSVWLAGGGSTPAYNNHFDYVSGEIRQESGVFGTTVNQFTAEGGLFKQVSGSPSWHARIVDASGVNGVSKSDAYISHQYKLRKTILVGAAETLYSGPTASLAGVWPGVALRDAANDNMTAIIPIDAELGNGVIEGVTVLFGTNTVGAGNYECVLYLSTATLNSAPEVVTPERTIVSTLNAGAQHTIKEQAIPFTELPFTKGDTILLKFERAGGVPNDTATTDMVVLGIRIKFRGKGPVTFDPAGIPAASMPAWNMP